MTVYAVHQTTGGDLVSVGSIVADPLPAGLAAVALSTPDAIALRDGTGIWDTTTRAVIPNPAYAAEQTRITNEATIRQRASAAIDTNATYLAIGSPTNAQNLAQIRALTRECTGLIRLALGALDTLDGT